MQIAENIRNTSALANLRPQDPDFVAPSLRKEIDKRAGRSGTTPLPRPTTAPKRVVPMSPSDHYRISQFQRNPSSLRQWTAENVRDPAVKVCTHLLRCVLPHGCHILTHCSAGFLSASLRACRCQAA